MNLVVTKGGIKAFETVCYPKLYYPGINYYQPIKFKTKEYNWYSVYLKGVEAHELAEESTEGFYSYKHLNELSDKQIISLTKFCLVECIIPKDSIVYMKDNQILSDHIIIMKINNIIEPIINLINWKLSDAKDLEKVKQYLLDKYSLK